MLPVDDGDLPVIPVVEVDAVHIAVDGVEHLHLDAGVLQGPEGIVGKAGEIAEVVEDDPHLHAGGGPLPQDGEDPVPDLPLRQDIILQEDIDLRPPEMVDQVVKEHVPLREIAGLRTAVEEELPLLQIGGQPSPGGRAAAQALDIDVTGHAGALPLRRRSHLPQAQALGLMGAAPQEEEDHAGYRQRQQKAHPHQLVGGTAPPLVHPDSHHGARQLQEHIDEVGLLRQQRRQSQGQHDLGDDRQRADGNAGEGGDPPLRPLLGLGRSSLLGHGGHLLSSPLRFDKSRCYYTETLTAPQPNFCKQSSPPSGRG